MSNQRKRIAAAISTALATFFLTACASSGSNGGGVGGDGSSPPPEESSPGPDDSGTFEVLAQPADAVLESESGEANPSQRVAVIDTGADTSHEEFEGDNGVGEPILTGREVYVPAQRCVDHDLGGCTDTGDITDEKGHGTAVASVIAGNTMGYTQNAELSIYDISDDPEGEASINSIAYGLGMAANENNKIANLSFQIDIVELRNSVDGSDSISDQAFTDFAANDIAAVVAAGNASENYSVNAGSSWEEEITLDDSIIDQVLVVGALSNGRLADYSNYAGANGLIQERFLVTQGTHVGASPGGGSATYYGTSFAAPVVSAALATLISRWDHLTMVEATQRLLETTDREFANENDVENDDYGLAECGDSGDVDCGLYTYGQGRLDFAAAMAPEGTPAVATTASVPHADNRDAGSPINETALMLPAGLGNAGDEIAAAASEVEVFDDLGRNYTADLSGAVRTQTDPTQGLGFKMSEFLSAGLTAPVATVTDKASGTRQMAGVDASGNLNVAAVGTDEKKHGLGFTAYHFGNGASAPDAAGFQSMGMVSYSGNTPMANQLDSANGVNVDVPLAGPLSLTSSYWQGEKRLSLDKTGQKNRISNIAVGLKAELIEGVDLTAGYASLDETAGFMGMTGMGGFATDTGSSMGLMQLGLNASFGGLQAFANYQSGRAQAAFGNSLITNLDADVEQMALGASYGFDQGRKQVALVASQPMHITGGTAGMKLAADRTKDGQVIYRNESVNFSGAEAPMNYEIGYRQRVGKTAMLGFNAMRMENGPNMEAGGVDHGAMAMISYGF